MPRLVSDLFTPDVMLTGHRVYLQYIRGATAHFLLKELHNDFFTQFAEKGTVTLIFTVTVAVFMTLNDVSDLHNKHLKHLVLPRAGFLQHFIYYYLSGKIQFKYTAELLRF